MKKNILILILMSLGTSVFAQNNIQKNFETSASIESYCQIQTSDINFGVVNSPLTAQSANAQMNVLCSNNTAYKVDLSYGGKYGEGAQVGDGKSYTYKSVGTGTFNGYPYTNYKFYVNGVALTSDSRDIGCRSGADTEINFVTLKAAQLFGYTSTGYNANNPNNPLCSGMVINDTSFNSLNGRLAYDYGVMKGSFKGDNLAYQISLPEDSSKIWNNGVNSHTSKGTGYNQVINLNAKIVVDKSSSLYVAADTYLDTVVANITY